MLAQRRGYMYGMMELFESGGFDCDFLEKPHDRLVCKICHFPCRKAQLTTCCGQIFCESDLTKLKGSTVIDKVCPICRSDDFKAYPQLEADREINALQVYCPNKELGCGCLWVGKLADLDSHLSSCEVGCDKCGELLPYKSFRMHIDSECPCYCQYCKITAESGVISNEHKNNCTMFPISCPNTCGEKNIPQGEIAKHKETCPLEVIWCMYHDMGCEVRLARKDMAQHYQEEIADHIRCVSLVTRKQTMVLCDSKAILEVSMSEVSGRVNSLLSHHAVQEETTEKLANEVAVVKEKIAKAKYMNSLVHTVSRNSLSVLLVILLAAMVFHYEQQISFLKVHISQLDGSIKFLNKRILESGNELKSQSNLQQNKIKFLIDSINNSHMQLEQKITVSITQPVNIITTIGSTLSSMTNAFYEYTTLKLWKLQIHNEMASTVAPAVLKLHNFTQKKKENETWLSHPFFAFDEGYQMVLNVDAAGIGEGKGTHVSVFLYLMKGPHDDELQALGYFSEANTIMQRGEFHIQLLNQLYDRNHFVMIMKEFGKSSPCGDVLITRVKTGEMAKEGCGNALFISHIKLMQSKTPLDINYIADGNLYFRFMFYKGDQQREIFDHSHKEEIKKLQLYKQMNLSLHEGLWLAKLYQSSELASHGDQVAPVILRMSHFLCKITTKKEWFSHPFFAFKWGYKMILKVSTNQDVDSDFLTCGGEYVIRPDYNSSIYMSLYLMKGPYDDKLYWPLRGAFTIELLNQNIDSDHYSHTFSLNKDICRRCVQRVIGRDRSRYSWKVHFDKLFHVMMHKPSATFVNDNIFIRISYAL